MRTFLMVERMVTLWVPIQLKWESVELSTSSCSHWNLVAMPRFLCKLSLLLSKLVTRRLRHENNNDNFCIRQGITVQKSIRCPSKLFFTPKVPYQVKNS